jgi:hypothetical protein
MVPGKEHVKNPCAVHLGQHVYSTCAGVRASGRRLAVKFKKKGGGEPRFQLKKER